MSSLVGRNSELATLLEAWHRGGTWTAIVGPPGVGKTRLMREALSSWPGDVMSLSWHQGVSQQEHLERLFHLCGLEPAPHLDVEAQSRVLARALNVCGPVCLALDDVEPVHAEWLASLFAAAPELRVVSTSHAPCQGAVTLSLGSMSMEGTPSAAAQLFLSCCPQATVEDAEMLAQHADGVPLAILLLARRARLMGASRLAQASHSEIISTLGRAATLHRAFAGLWSSLGEDVRDAARWCATFVGSFASEDGAGLLTRVGHDAWEMLEALESCGLLEIDTGPRLRMLRPLRAFVLQETEREGCEIVFSQYFAERCMLEVERTWRIGRGAGMVWWNAEREHVLHASRCAGLSSVARAQLALAQHTFEAIMRAPALELRDTTEQLIAAGVGGVLGACLRIYHARHLAVLDVDVEGADAVLDRIDTQEHPIPVLCEMARARSAFLLREDTEESCERAVALATSLGWNGVESDARMLLGMSHQWAGRLTQARVAFTQVRALSQRDVWSEMMAQALLGQLDQLDGDLDAAARRYDACWAIQHEFGLDMIVFASVAEMMFFAARGEFGRALGAGEVLLARMQTRKAPGPEFVCRCVMAWCHHMQGSAEKAEEAQFLAQRMMLVDTALHAHEEVWRVTVCAMNGEVPPEGEGHLFAALMRSVVASTRQVQTEEIRWSAQEGWFERAGFKRCSLKRRHVARRVFFALVEAHQTQPGNGCSIDALIEAAWPGECILYDAALTRLRVLVHGLRELGLRDLLLTVEGGYALDTSVVLHGV